MLTNTAFMVATKVCPKMPAGAQKPVDEITAYVLAGIGVLFLLGLLVCVGAIVAGRVFGMPHASKVGVIGLVIIFVAAIGYLVLPGMLDGIIGSGCIN